MKDVLLCIEPATPSLAHVTVAAHAAATLGAHLTALFVRPEPDIPVAVRLQMPDVDKVLADNDRQVADEARDLAASLIQPTGAPFQWVEATGPADEVLVRRSRTADMVVALSSARQPGDTRDRPGVNPLIGSLVLHSGRPVLVVPADLQRAAFGRVAVCWDGSRESSRALHDALPLLKAALSVDLLMVVAGGRPGDGDRHAGFGSEVRSHLARHGVSATARVVRQSQGLGVDDALLDWVDDAGVDLMVMGAFGRSRLREIILGSVTAGVVGRAKIPVLISH